MEELRGPNAGTFTLKRIYDMNQKTEDLHDYVTGLLPESNDAEKTISKLDRSNINHFYILHDDTGLYAYSKGRPSKEAVRIRLDCSAKIQADLEHLREDNILNEKSQMLVMVSMATDEMIRLVSMYPDMWFVDTVGTARETACCSGTPYFLLNRKYVHVSVYRLSCGSLLPQ